MFITVVIFLLILLGIGIFTKNYTTEGFWIFRVILSLMAGAFTASAIPGNLNLTAKVGSFAVKATGAVGVFVLVYWSNPPQLIKNQMSLTSEKQIEIKQSH